ncbi:MAG: hypothetical protein QM757_26705 [Paludibaculum sp.]
MINPYSLIDALVDVLQSIAALADSVGGPENIVAHRDSYPAPTTTEAIYRMPAPGILIIWDGSGPSQSGGRELWSHSFRIVFRCAAELVDAPGGYGQMWSNFINGVPAMQALPFYRCKIHDSCYEISTPSITRAFLLVDPETNSGLEYFESRFSLTEKG